MKIAIIGATGMIGSRLVTETTRRGHAVTAVSRSAAACDFDTIRAVTADATNPAAMRALAREHDVLVLATRPAPGDEHTVREPVRTVLAAAHESRRRVYIVGGSAPLRHPHGAGRVIDDPHFIPAEWRQVARASVEQHEECLRSAADWVYLSPPALIEPGECTGLYVLGRDTLLVDDSGASRISAEDFAVMIADQLEAPTPGIRHLTAVAALTESDTVEPSSITGGESRVAQAAMRAPTV